MTQRESGGNWEIGCKTCPAGQYPGPGWECKKCNGYGKEYKERANGWECACIDGFKTVGEYCVTDADYQDLENNANLPAMKDH